MRDIDITKIVGIPTATVARWKQESAGDFRKKIYVHLSEMSLQDGKRNFQRSFKHDIEERVEFLIREYKGEYPELYKQGCFNALSICMLNTPEETVKKAVQFHQYALDALEKKAFLGAPENKFFIEGSRDVTKGIQSELKQYM